MPRRPSSPRLLLHFLQGALQPVFAFDEQRKLFFANEAACQWLGRKEGELLGQSACYDGSGQAASLVARISPPLEAWEGQVVTAELAGPASSATPASRRSVLFLPLHDAEGKSTGLLGIVLPEGVSLPQVAEVAESSALHVRLQEIHRDLQPRYDKLPLLGDTPAMFRVREQVRIASLSAGRALIIGPSGSGKEHVARAIHFDSARPTNDLLIPLAGRFADPELVQSVVTTCLRNMRSKSSGLPTALWIQDADRLSSAGQMELINLLQLPKVELPIVATATRSLVSLAKKGRYDAALAEALSPLVIQLPALRSRSADIPLLAQHLVETWNSTARDPSAQRSGFSSAALDELAEYEWPGELAELQQVVLAACERCQGSQISASDLPDKLRLAVGAVAYPPKPVVKVDLEGELAALEKQLIEQALQQAKNNKTKAATLLQISRARLLRRMAHFGLLASTDEEPIIFEPLEEDVGG